MDDGDVSSALRLGLRAATPGKGWALILEIKSGGDTWAPGHSMGQVRTYHKVQHRQIESGGILAGRIKEDFLGEVACMLDLRIWKD